MGRQRCRDKKPLFPKGELRFAKFFYVRNYSKVEVEDLKPGLVMKRRSLPIGKGDGEMGQNQCPRGWELSSLFSFFQLHSSTVSGLCVGKSPLEDLGA